MERVVRHGHTQMLIDKLNETVEQYEQVYIEEAKAKAEYYKQKRMVVLQMKASGEKVGNINNLVDGVPEVNEAMTRYNIAEAMRKTKEEQINVLKIQIKLLGSDY